MLLVFTVQVLYNCFCENVIYVSTWCLAYASVFGACIQRYGKLLPLLGPVEYAVISLGGSPYSIRFYMVVSGLLIPLLWQEKLNWVFSHIIHLVDDYGVYLTIIIFNLTIHHNLSSDLD